MRPSLGVVLVVVVVRVSLPPCDACPIGRTTRSGPIPPPSDAPCLPTMEMDDARDAAVAVAMAATQITILCFGGEMVGCQWDSRY